jgi:alkylation response protein AidB-like acyl-CoA dehydrogenase
MTTAPSVTVIQTTDEAILAARRYARSIADGTVGRDRAGQVPAAELAALDASGLLAITVPAEHRGPGLPPDHGQI